MQQVQHRMRSPKGEGSRGAVLALRPASMSWGHTALSLAMHIVIIKCSLQSHQLPARTQTPQHSHLVLAAHGGLSQGPSGR